MNVLITNDDGINARGLKELVHALKHQAGMDIYVCAPDGQRSASGHGITMMENIFVNEVEMEDVEIAYQTTGLPADCVKLAIELLSRIGIETHMVFSGINHGGNLGTDTLYSGTVAAAMEGSLNEIPSVAVSVDSHQAEHFEFACDLAVKAALKLKEKITEGCADHRIVLNINTPNLPEDQIKGVKFTRLGSREYDEEFSPTDEGENKNVPGSFRYYGTPVFYEDYPDDIDVVANQENYASITPVRTDQTYYEKIEEIKGWGLTE